MHVTYDPQLPTSWAVKPIQDPDTGHWRLNLLCRDKPPEPDDMVYILDWYDRVRHDAAT